MNIPAPHRKTIWASILFLLLTVNSCSQAPYPVSYGFSQQQKMQSVNHWEILAQDTAAQLHRKLNSTLPLKPNSCVSFQPDDSLFGIAFTKLLKADLLQRIDKETNDNPLESAGPNVPAKLDVCSHYILTDTPEAGCLQVKLSAQVIKHRADRQGRFYPGTFTFLSSAVAVMRDFAWYEALVGAGLVADIVSGTSNTLPHNEILITTQISNANRLLSLQTDMYYINDQDTWHYEQQKPIQGRNFQVVGGQ